MLKSKNNNPLKIIWIIGVFFSVGLFVSFFSNVLLDLLHSNFDWEHVVFLITESRSRVFLLGTLVLFVFYLFFTSLFGSKLIGSSTLLLISFSIGLASNFKMEYRAEPLYPNEMTMVNELPFLMEMIGLQQSITVLLFLIVIILSIIFTYRWYLKQHPPVFQKRTSLILRIVGVLVSFLCLVYINRFNQQEHRLKEIFSNNAEWITYHQTRNYTDNTFVAGFLYNLQAEPMDELPSYSRELIEELVEKYSLISEEINSNRSNVSTDANLIFVMNESFSDPLRLEGFQTDRDPFSFFREFSDSTLSGNSLSQSSGGGTANSEFEALTALSMEPFAVNISTPFVQLTDQMDNVPSVAKFMQEMGHVSTAIHAHNYRFYRRREVYNSLGFDEIIFSDTMQYTETLDGSPYISDASAYREVLTVMEETPERDFIHLVTMQNHLPHASRYDTVYFESSGSGNDAEANGYLQDMYHSDQFLENFIEELDNLDEPTILVFWGDHLPGFYGNQIREDNSDLVLHETPLLIYSNYTDLEGNIGTISPIFFMNHVLDILDMEVTPYQALVYQLEERLPAFRDGLYLEENQQTTQTLREDLDEQTLTLLTDYHLLQYDLITGRNYASELGFYDRALN